MNPRDLTLDLAPAYGLPGYAELHCLSNFSFLRGASSPEELAAEAARLGYQALALTDECSLAGIVRAHVEIERLRRETGHAPKLIAGAELRLQADDSAPACTLVVLAQDREGYGNLCELITLARTRPGPKGGYRLHPRDLTQPDSGYAHLAGLPGCLVLLSPEHGASLDALAPQARWAASAFPGRAWLALTLLHRGRDERHKAVLAEASRLGGLPLAAAGQVEMHRRSRKALHDTLAAIRLRKPVRDCGYALAPNAEQHLRARLRLSALYPAQALQETLRLAERCAFTLDELRYEYPEEIVPAGMTPGSYLHEQAWLGAQRRYPGGVPAAVAGQIERELQLIAELRFDTYFLTVYDLVREARRLGILCQGRGSAANSAVCYCLGITEVDPADGNSLFERFISRERGEPPDIDVDFEHQRREEIIQYIYRRYGRQRAALTAVVITYRRRSALRDTGRALDIDPAIVDTVAKAHQWWDGKRDLLGRLAECGLDPESPAARHWAELAQTLAGFPRHLSQHPGGFVLSHTRLSRLVPIENAAMPGRSVVQWDKDDLDAVGLLKVDVLALGMLTVLRRALAWTAWRRGRDGFRLQDVPRGDTATYDMICRADTIGVFQIESRAQMSMLPRLRPREFYDLVVQVAIVRPGPIQGGMVHPYLKRRRDPSLIDYPGDAVRDVLERTKGVPIFQEQVMQIAMKAAGFSADDADALRRSMAAWRRKGGVDKFRAKLVDGLLANGYAPDFAEALFRQIEGFGEYGFPESHAASFAQLAYFSAWLKCHEPEAFLAALLDSQPMGFYAPSQLIQDARRHGVTVLPADAAHSDWECLLVPAPTPPADAAGDARPAVRLGLNQIRGLNEDAARRVAAARRDGPFLDAADLARRAGLGRRDMDALAAANALRAWTAHRRQARWAAAAGPPPPDLLRDAPPPDPEQPVLPPPSEGQDIAADYAATGYTLARHPLALLRPRLDRLRFASAQSLRDYPHGRLARACGLVTIRQRPGTAKGVIFVTLEDETGTVNVIVRPELAERQRHELLASPLMAAIGTWQNLDGVRHLLAGRLEDHSPLLGSLSVRSRDFH